MMSQLEVQSIIPTKKIKTHRYDIKFYYLYRGVSRPFLSPCHHDKPKGTGQKGTKGDKKGQNIHKNT